METSANMRTLIVIVTALLAASSTLAQVRKTVPVTAVDPAVEAMVPTILSTIEMAAPTVRTEAADASRPIRTEACDSFLTAPACGGTVSAILSSADCQLSSGSYAEFHRFDGAVAGQPFTATISTTSASTLLLTVQNFNTAAVMASNFGTSRASVTFTPTTTGPVILGVTTIESFRSFTYTLAISCGSSTGGGGCQYGPDVTCNSATIVGTLQAGECATGSGAYSDSYQMFIKKGQTVQINVKSDTPLYVEAGFAPSRADDFVDGAFVQGHNQEELYYTSIADGWIDITISTMAVKRTAGYTMTVSCPSSIGVCKQRAVRK